MTKHAFCNLLKEIYVSKQNIVNPEAWILRLWEKNKTIFSVCGNAGIQRRIMLLCIWRRRRRKEILITDCWVPKRVTLANRIFSLLTTACKFCLCEPCLESHKVIWSYVCEHVWSLSYNLDPKKSSQNKHWDTVWNVNQKNAERCLLETHTKSLHVCVMIQCFMTWWTSLHRCLATSLLRMPPNHDPKPITKPIKRFPVEWLFF